MMFGYVSCSSGGWLVSYTLIMQYYTTAASAPTNLMAVQVGPTGIRVFWTPPTPLRFTSGYRISYSGGNSRSVHVNGGSTDNYLLTGLHNRERYSLSIMGTSHHFSSEHVDLSNSIFLGEFTKLYLVLCYDTSFTVLQRQFQACQLLWWVLYQSLQATFPGAYPVAL